MSGLRPPPLDDAVRKDEEAGHKPEAPAPGHAGPGSRFGLCPASSSFRRKTLEFGLLFFGGDEGSSAWEKYQFVIDVAKYADETGFVAVWLPERHFTAMGSLYPNPAVLHAALARETRRVRLYLVGELGCPFLKRELLAANPMHVPFLNQWRKVIENTTDYDTDLIAQHLEATIRNRAI